MRTHTLVCLAACLFVRLGQLLIADSARLFSPQIMLADPVRIIEAIVTGVAFLGARAFRIPRTTQWLERRIAEHERGGEKAKIARDKSNVGKS
ncbi:MAG: MgtC/SapB family protein [Chthoniobacteraceae bacterium]